MIAPRAWPSRLADALSDPARRERSMLITLAGYIAVWTLYGVIAKASQDVQFDAAELVVWAREPALGYAKHPPLAAWLVHGWFSVFPVRDATYYLFAMTYAALGLWLAWRLFGVLLEPGKRIVAVALLTLIPYFNFHGLRFDANAILGATWAATTLCFIRSFETRAPRWAALAGAAAAAAMLAKYWSVFLLIGLALAALLDRRRAEYFRSSAPWITTAAGLVVLAPHLAWLASRDFSPMSYAIAAHGFRPFEHALARSIGYVAGGLGYAAAPALLLVLLTRPSREALRDTLLPQAPDGRFLAVIFWTTLLLPALVSPLILFELSSLWAMPVLILLPLVVVASPLLTIGRRALVTIVGIAIALPLAALAAAPAIALVQHLAGVVPTGAHARLLAERIDREWRQTTTQPLRIVGGDLDVAYSVTFYLPGGPAAYPVLEPENTPWVTPERISQEGAAFICFMFYDRREGRECRDRPVNWGFDKLIADNQAVRRIEFRLTRTFLGFPGEPARYLLVIAPPK